jgi:hypothetical protein
MDMSTSTVLVPVAPVFADAERLALAGFLAGYRGVTRDAYELDLRQFAVWCAEHDRRLFEVHRVDIERFSRDREARGRARSTIARRLCTISSFYRYAEEEGLIEHSPAVHVRRPRLDYESHAVGLGRDETRCPPGDGGALIGSRSCAGVAPRPQRPARLRSAWGRHRCPRPRARAPNAHGDSQGRKDGDHASRASRRPRA